MMGRCKNYNRDTVAPETRHKETKMDAHKTNNQATVGSSILMCNLEAEADRRLTRASGWRMHAARAVGQKRYALNS